MFLQQATVIRKDDKEVFKIYKGDQQVWPAETQANVEPDLLKTPFWIMNLDTNDLRYKIYNVSNPPFVPDMWYSDDLENWTLVPAKELMILPPGGKRYFIGKKYDWMNQLLRNEQGGTLTEGKIQLGGNYRSLFVNSLEEWNDMVEKEPFKLLEQDYAYILYGSFYNNTAIHYAHTMYVPYTFDTLQRIGNAFQGCTNMKTGPIFTNPPQNRSDRDIWVLPWLSSCFRYCTSLISEGVYLPDYSYRNYKNYSQYLWTRLFEGCTSLTKPPKLFDDVTEDAPFQVEYLVYKPFDRTFKDCTNLTETMDIVFSDDFYLNPQEQMPLMYENCTSLTTATFRNVGRVATNPVFDMYNGCTGIRELHFEIKHDINFAAGSFERMSPNVTLYKPAGYTYTGYPSTWTVVDVE